MAAGNSTGSSMSSASSTTQACAACKFQRRKCMPECPLAPYFPPDQPKQFLNVHKLYGVSNTLRILKQVEPSKRNDAMKSIVYEADARDRDPVHGCFGVITLLQSQAEMLREELEYVRTQVHLLEQQQALAYYNQAQQQQAQLQPFSSNPLISTIPTTTNHHHYHPLHDNHNAGGVVNQSWAAQHQLAAASSIAGTSPTSAPSWLYQYMATSPHMQTAVADTTIAPTGSGGPLSKPSIEVRPSFDTRALVNYEPGQHSFLHHLAPKTEAYESSAESSIKDAESLEHEELESAAALFTLTSSHS